MKLLFASAAVCLFSLAVDAATFNVTTTSDAGPGSLRQAITDANANPGLDTIDFNIGTGPQEIHVLSTLVVTSPLIIDGSTQEGYSGTPLIFINGAGLGADGLVFAAGADGSAVRNIEIGGFLGTFDTASIAITGANNITIAGNYIGGVRNFLRRSRCGIRVHTSNNTIGGLTAADRNVGVNESREVLLEFTASGNVIRANYFGFDPTGLVARFPASIDIFIRGASNNVIGGTQPGARNVMITSGDAILMTNGAQGNVVEGNYVGLGANGLPAAPFLPGASGVFLDSTVTANTVGGVISATRNVISNNATGVAVGSAGNLIEGNFIGTDPSGLVAAPNDLGMIVSGSATNPILIGGTAVGAGNLISGNATFGLYLSAKSVVLQGNYIGTTVTGLAPLPNGGAGVHLQNVGATIGTGSANGRNVISGNVGNGIEGTGIVFSAGHAISGNCIGLGADGVTSLPNGGNGVSLDSNLGPTAIQLNGIANNVLAGIRLHSTSDVAVGGNAATANTISANHGAGVAITGSSIRNVVAANSIDVNGGLGIDLGDDGVTANDSLDTDGGPNSQQNYPILTRAITGGGQTNVTGMLSSTPVTSFTLDFYASPAKDPSGFGEGKRYLGTTAVMTDAAGAAALTATVATAGIGEFVTATATAAAAGTSEFSNAIPTEPAGTLQFSSSSYVAVEGNTATITVTRVSGSAGTVTVAYGTGGGTATAGVDYTPENGMLTFGDGQLLARFTIPIATDSLTEGFETVQLTLSNATNGATLGTPSQAILTIADPSAIPVFDGIAATALFVLLALIATRSLSTA